MEIGKLLAIVDPDTGACAYVTDEHQHNAVKNIQVRKLKLENSRAQLKTINTHLDTIEEFWTTIKTQKGVKMTIFSD